jgi:hypothetical protein
MTTGNPIADGVMGMVKGIMKPVGDIIDNTTTNQEERGEIKAKIYDAIASSMADNEKELTKRLEADMKSDSWMSKNIRPMTLIFVLALYTIFSLTDGNIGEFNITDAYVSLLGQWGMLIMSFYFGGRSVEKVMDKINLKRDKRERRDK